MTARTVRSRVDRLEKHMNRNEKPVVINLFEDPQTDWELEVNRRSEEQLAAAQAAGRPTVIVQVVYEEAETGREVGDAS